MPKPDLGRSRCDELAVSRPQSILCGGAPRVPEPRFFMHAIAWSSASEVTDHPLSTAASRAFFAVTSSPRTGKVVPGLFRQRTKACTFGHEARLQEPPQSHDDLRATATIAIRRTRPLASPTRSWNHWLMALSGWCIRPKPGELDGMMPDDGVAGLADPLVALSSSRCCSAFRSGPRGWPAVFDYRTSCRPAPSRTRSTWSDRARSAAARCIAFGSRSFSW